MKCLLQLKLLPMEANRKMNLQRMEVPTLTRRVMVHRLLRKVTTKIIKEEIKAEVEIETTQRMLTSTEAGETILPRGTEMETVMTIGREIRKRKIRRKRRTNLTRKRKTKRILRRSIRQLLKVQKRLKVRSKRC